jgi:hypothetical protein
MPEYVKLVGKPGQPGEHICDSVENAVVALDELGFCMNWATLVKVSGTPMLMYQGWILRHSFERFVELPFSEDAVDFKEELRKLLTDIFAPFVGDSHILWPQAVDIFSHPTEKDTFVAVMLITFKDESAYAEADKALSSAEDSHDEIQGKAFWLD